MSRKFVSLLWILIGTLASVCANADWLSDQRQADGSVATANDLATPTQATSEAVRTLRMLGRASEATAAEAFIGAETYLGTEYLSRRIVAKADAGTIDPAAIVELQSRQNTDGGFGEFSLYSSNALDTAMAVEALAAAGQASSSSAGYGVGYLLQKQRTDGAWADSSGAADVFTTALVMRALNLYRDRFAAVPASVANAGNFLLAKRSAEGAWGEPLVTAQALLALSSSLSDVTPLDLTKTALTGAQRADGSWSDDVYSTALALRALFVFDARRSGGTTTGSGGVVSGYVLRAGSSEPLGGATVMLAAKAASSVQTNADGYFVLNGVPAGDQTLLASKAGFGLASKVATLRAGEFSNAGEIYLSQDATEALVSGSIFDSLTGLPLGGAAVKLTGAAALSATTAQDGTFELDALPAGDYSIAIDKSGYYSVNGTVTVAAGSTTSLRQGLLQEGAYLDTSAGTLSGHVLDALTNLPISSALLALDNSSTTTSADGGFALNSIARGAYQMQVSATGYQSAQLSFVFAPGTNGELGAIKLYPVVGAQAPSTITLIGTVVDSIDNRPLANASIQIDSTGPSVTTDALGKFRLEGLTALSFSVTATAADHETRVFSATVSAFGEVAGTFALPPAGGTATATTTTIQGTVKDGSTGQPLAGARVEIPGTALTATSDVDGSFTLSDISTLSFSLYASAPGYVGNPYSIELTQHGDYDIDVNLNPDPGAAAATFQVLSVNPVVTNTGAHAQQKFALRVVNLAADSQSALILVQAFDSTGVSVGRFNPFAEGTEIPTAEFSFAANETKDLVIPWDTAQLPPGAYRIAVQIAQPGTVTRELPSGVVLAQGETLAAVVASEAMAGQTTFDPPLTQAGTSNPVSLSALVLNAGNVPLMGASFTLSITDPTTNQVVYTAQTVVPMIEVANNVTLNFGGWVPSVTGDLVVRVRADDPALAGEIEGRLYVGDKATGTFVVDKSTVPVGTQTVHATVSLQGVDTRTGTSTDPLFFAVKEAIRKGGLFVGPQVKQWNEAGRCLGCHIQTQSFMGMASAVDKADIDRKAVEYLYNDLAGASQANGAIYASHGDYYPRTQTALAMWSLSNWHNSPQIFRTLYRAANYQLGQMSTSGNQSWWNYDHCGVWYCVTEAQTMAVVKGMAAVLKTAEDLGPNSVDDFAFDDLGFDTGIRDVMGMQIGPDGWLWYLDSAGGLYARDLATNASRTVATGLGTTSTPAVGLVVTSDGTAYVSSRTGLFKIDPGGGKTSLLPASSDRWDVAQGPDGALYVADRTQILRVLPNGQSSVYVSGGLLNQVTGLLFDADGTLYAANANSYNILKIAPDKTVSVFADGLTFRPAWLRRGADGYLYTSTVQYSNTGTVQPGIYRIDAQGYVERAAPFNAPNAHGLNAIGVIDGSIVIHNASNRHLYKLRVVPQDTSKLSNMRNALANAVRYTLARYNDNNSRNDIHAMRLITLAEARPYVTDATLLAQIDTAIDKIATLLRNRQRSNGGWTYTTGRTASDPYTTAHVGMALDYTNPSVDDPMVRNSISYLLSSQASDNSWPYSNGPFTTKLGPTSFVMAYLPLALDRLGGIDTDLHISIPANNQLSNVSVPPTVETTNADGSVSYKWSLQGVTAKTRKIEFDLTLSDMVFNEDRAVATAAYLEFENSFSSETLRSDVVIPHVQASRDASLDVTTDRASYPADSAVAIAAKVTNIGPPIANATAHLVVRTTDGNLVADLGDFGVGPLATNASVLLPATWNTAAYLAGPYQVYGQLFATGGEPLYEDTTAFEIVTGSAVVGATISPDKPAYKAWDAVTLDSRIRNLVANAIQPNSIAEVTVLTPSGVTLFYSTYGVGELAPSALRDIQSPLNLIDAESGMYPVNLVVKDAFSHNVVATAAGSFQVEREEIQALSGNVKVAAVQVYQGDPNLCTDTVNNQSTSPLAQVNVTQQLVGLASEQVIASEVVTVDLTGKQTQTLFRTIGTNALPLGGYACVLSATVNGTTQQLGQAGFQVVPPPIRVESQMQLGRHGRVLVLVDGVVTPPQATDPFGPTAAPDLNTQRAHIESVLKDHGWSYTIVDNAIEFEREFNTGGYEVVVIYPEVVKIPESLQDRIVAEVAKGLGLIVAGNHDNRNGRLDAALGIHSLGKNLDVSALSMEASEVMDASQESFPAITPPNSIRLEGATAIAHYKLLKEKPGDEPEPAVTVNRFGLGKALYAGFDLPLQGAAAGDDSLFGLLFARSLDFVHPDTLTPYARRVVPIDLTLTNLGVATPGLVTVVLPEGSQSVDAGLATVSPDGRTLAWPFSLGPNEVMTLPFWIRLPDALGDVTVFAHVQVGAPGNLQDHSDSALTIRLEVRP